MRNKRIVITGGAGLLGSHLARSIASSNEVLIIDDLSKGSIKNLSDLISRDNITLIKGSVLDNKLLDRNLQGAHYVFHYASIGSVPRSYENLLLVNDVNVKGTLNVLLAAKNNKVGKVILASSSAVYGDTPMIPNTEGVYVDMLSPYALSKWFSEYYGTIFQKEYGLPTVCLRYFNVYGPISNPMSEYEDVIPNSIIKIANDESPVIYGSGNQTRDFVFVQDAVQASILAAECKLNGVINVGSGRKISINKLISLIIKLLGKDVQPVYKEARAGDIKESWADLSLANSIGYLPRFSLEEGLKETIRSMIDES